MLIQRRLPRGLGAPYTRRVLQLSADAPLFRTRLPMLPGDPYRRQLIGYFVASDHLAPIPGGGGGPRQTSVTIISG